MITYAVDGVPLDDPDGRWRLLRDTLIGPALTLRTVDQSIPGMDGNFTVAYEPLDMPSVTVKMGVYGRDYASLMANYGTLLAVLAPRSDAVITKTVDGVSRSMVARGKSTTAPEFHPAGMRLSFTSELRLPGVFWRGDTATWRQAAPTSGVAYPVSTLDGSTAPVDDALVLISGPVTNPRVSCGSAWFRLGLTLTSGQAALVDCRAWSVRAGSGVTLAGGGTVRTGVLTTSGGPYLLRLVPQMVGTDPAVTQVKAALSFDSGTPSLAIAAASAFLV